MYNYNKKGFLLIMNNKLQEKKIIKYIFLTPIFSLILFAILVFSSLAFYFNQFKKDEIKEYKHLIIEERKNETKNILLSVVEDINHDIHDLNRNLKDELKERVYEANNIINRVIKNNPNKSQKEIENIIKQVLSAIRFNHGRGYYFVYNYTSKITIIHPIKKFLNKDMSKFKDKRGTLIVSLTNSIIQKQKEGYATIYFAKPNQENKEFKKIIYVRYIPKLNWVIGTGEYVNDALDELKKELLKEIQSKRYGKNGYFWIQNNKKILIHIDSKYIGKNISTIKDIKGHKIFLRFLKEAKQNKNGTFVKYYWENPTTHKIEEKISFVYYIPQLNWVIGTGLYLNDLHSILDKKAKQTNKKIHEIISIIFILLIILSIIVGVISYILSRYTKSLFEIYKNDLEHKIEKAVEENTKKDKILQEQSKLAAMGEMIGAIAHQWRQPLNSLGLNIQLLVDDYLDGKIDEKYLEQFEQKQMEIIKFMSKTIDDFRNFFNIDKEKKEFSVKQSIKEVLDIVSAQMKNHNIQLELLGDDFKINGYKSEFNQVILNLINNAKDAIISKKINDGKITITIKNGTIIIQDNGIDIPKDIKDRIFEPYFTTKESGTGIGLYMSKMIIDKMGGKLYLGKNKQFIIEGFK